VRRGDRRRRRPRAAARRRAARLSGSACAGCHAGHADGGGVAFSRAGGALRHGPGGATPLAAAPLFRPRADLTVPIIPAGACARCHDLSAARDPISACLVAGQESLGRRRPAVCFDEHRRAGDESGAAAARSAAWEAAREVAAIAPLAPAAPASPARARPWLWLALAALGAALTRSAIRALDRRRRRRARAASSLPGGDAAAVRPPDSVRLPVVNSATCLGCYACVDACPYDVLEIRRYVAVVARPADCCGLTLCEQKCPNGSLVMTDPATGSEDVTATALAVPAGLTDSLESREVPGLFLAGDLTGLALIRNAINQGAHAVRSIAARSTRTPARARGRAEARASASALTSTGAGWPRPARRSSWRSGSASSAASSRPSARGSA